MTPIELAKEMLDPAENDFVHLKVRALAEALIETQNRLDLAIRIITAWEDWERRNFKGMPVSLYGLMEVWRDGPKEIHLN